MAAIHYVAESKFANNKKYMKEISSKWIVVIAMPFGCLLHKYIKRKVNI